MFAGAKRPGMDQGGGALVQAKRPRQELVAITADARGKQLAQMVGGGALIRVHSVSKSCMYPPSRVLHGRPPWRHR